METDYVRIATNYFRIVEKPNNQGELQPKLIPWKRQTILDDYDKDYANAIEKFKDFIIEPNHLNYNRNIQNFYNKYSPLSHNLKADYKDNQLTSTLQFLEHIFGDQLNFGLDYLSLLMQKPREILPILCLVSDERNTGKTTFLNWLKLIFEDNKTNVTNEDLRGRFNSDWTEKLIIGVDEVYLEKKQDSERLKNLSTANTFKTESKGKDKYESEFFGKFILCSNNETNFIQISDREIRFWIRKVPTLKVMDPNLFENLIIEAHYFACFLANRAIKQKKDTRMWFTPEQIYTDALGVVKRGTKHSQETELIEILLDMYSKFETDEICLTGREIQECFRSSGHSISKQEISRIVENIWKLKKTNSSYVSYITTLNHQSEEVIGSEKLKGRFYTFQKNFIDSMLNC